MGTAHDWWRFVLAATVTLLCNLCAAENIGKLLAAGDAALSNSQYAAAINHYTSALALDAKAALIYNKRAAAYSAQGSHQKALRDYDSSIQLHPDSTAARLGRAKLQRGVCDLAAAEADADSVLQKKTGHKAAAEERVRISAARRLLQEAEAKRDKQQRRKAVSQLLDISPHCAWAKILQAEFMLEDENFGGVVLLTGQVLKTEPASVAALLLRGHAYTNLGDLDVAKRHFSEALRSDPDHKEAKALFRKLKKLQRHRQQAEAAKEGGRDEEAEAEFAEALAMEPASRALAGALWLELCRARLRLLKADSAAAACGTAHEMLPDEEDAVVLKIKSLILSGDHSAAMSEAGAARRRFGNSQQVFQVLREAEKAQRMAERKQYYEILNVSRDAGDLEIKRAYRELARKFHPDKAVAEGISPELAHDKFTEISEAYEVLSDGERRMAYDRGDDLRDGQAGYQSGGFQGGFPGGFQNGGQHFTFHFG